MNGIIGLETSWAVAKKELVDTGILTPSQLVEKMRSESCQNLKDSQGDACGGIAARICVLPIRMKNIR